MKLVLIGVGQAGGKIVDSLLAYEAETNTDFVVDAIALNTARADLRGLSRVPESNRHLFGQADVNGHGVGADNELAAEIAERESRELLRSTDGIATSRAEAFLIVGALGGGTGSGTAPVLARNLRRIYTQPVYALGVLPGRDEGSVYSLNAARSLRTLVDEVDNLLLFDNETWASGGSGLEASYDAMNEEIARRFGVLFGAGEVTAGDAVAESVVDSSEIINTLDGGGVSTVGYAASELSTEDGGGSRFGLSRFLGTSEPEVDSTEAISRITTSVRKAARGRLTLPCDLGSTDRALVVVSGPPEWLNRKGIERGRQWIEEETGCLEVRGGDYPIPDSEYVAVDMLFSGVTDVQRIKQLQAIAVEAQDAQAERETTSADDLSDLVDDTDADELDSLF